MERGPAALFGAIVAVGLGPALWLGAQFGRTATAPADEPPAIVSEQKVDRSASSGGGGSAPQDPSGVVPTQPRSGAQLDPLPAASPQQPSATGDGEAADPEPSRTTAAGTPSASSTSGPSTPSASATPTGGAATPPSPSPSSTGGSGTGASDPATEDDGQNGAGSTGGQDGGGQNTGDAGDVELASAG
ncbi:hypothetical protein [Mangrovihabitans endophyticus]|uniref:Uncharacterized protein n=1 Tax=Mangrovihabitans endophyticus TaxID=1751298 RepID=A0A8J3C3C2_9ACTN|nr:hypothetical protein [Mangrovihabitans endophyticus]GGL02252.1 hypothetical protein GCM10012284_40950 [Mangrovihabitans endophyticus]